MTTTATQTAIGALSVFLIAPDEYTQVRSPSKKPRDIFKRLKIERHKQLSPERKASAMNEVSSAAQDSSFPKASYSPSQEEKGGVIAKTARFVVFSE